MQIQRVAQKGIILNENRDKILLNRYLESKYLPEKLCGKLCFPGGQIDWGEDPDKSFIREIKEETGVEIETGEPFDIWSWTYEKDGDQKQIIAIARFGYYKSGNIREPINEVETKLEKAKWHDIKSLNLKEFVEDEIEVMKKAIELTCKR